MDMAQEVAFQPVQVAERGLELRKTLFGRVGHQWLFGRHQFHIGEILLGLLSDQEVVECPAFGVRLGALPRVAEARVVGDECRQ